jgi:hypothetical protein
MSTLRSKCFRGKLISGIFYEEGTGYHFHPTSSKQVKVPEGVDIFLNIDQHDCVIDYVRVD